MFKKVEKFELRGRICAFVTTECFERMDILSGQNTERVKFIKLVSFIIKD